MTSEEKILIVGGKATAARELADELRNSGYHVTGLAVSGEEALEQIGQAFPDLILLDVRLKGTMNAIESAGQIYRDFDLPVVFLTTHADGEFLQHAENAEQFYYVMKPYKIADLLSIVSTALSKHRFKQKLKKQETWLTTALDSADDGVIVTDTFSQIRFCNHRAAEILSLLDNDVTGHRWSDVVHLQNRITGVESGDLVQLTILQGTTTDLGKDLVAKLSSGEMREIDGEIALCRLDDAVIGTVFTFRATTLRNRREDQLRQAVKSHAIAQLAGVVSNQISTLLKTTVKHTDAALDGIEAGHRVRGSLEAIKTGVDDMSRLAGHLSTVSKSPVCFPRELDLNEVTSEACFTLRNQIPAKIDLVTELCPNLSAIRADAAEIKKAIVRLALYAGAAMPYGGAIRMETKAYSYERYGPGRETGNYVGLTIGYMGSEIAQEEKQVLFDPFSQFDVAGGVDLSLFLVRRIIENAQGSITATSNEGGNTFEILLPQAAARGNTVYFSEYPVAPGPSVLLVEADAGIRDTLGKVLESEGYEVLGASNSTEALQWLESYDAPIEMLVTSMAMPGMNGTELAREFMRRHSALRTIFISDETIDSSLGETWSNVGARFLQKPFGKEEFGQLVREMTEPTNYNVHRYGGGSAD